MAEQNPLDSALILKDSGNEFFKQGLWENAIEKYIVASKLIDPSNFLSKYDVHHKRLYSQCQSNAAQCSLNLGNFEDANDYCSNAILHDKNNEKNLYRRALSYIGLFNTNPIKYKSFYIYAFNDLELAYSLSPHNMAIKVKLEEVSTLCVLDSIKRQDLNNIPDFIHRVPNIDVVSTDGFTALQIAVIKRETRILELLLNSGADPTKTTKTNNDYPPIITACLRGYIEIAMLLLSKNVDINTIGIYGTTPLHAAVMEGHSWLAYLLLRDGAYVDSTLIDGSTPLFMAVANNDCKIIKLLLSYGARIDIQNNDKLTCLDICNNKKIRCIFAVSMTLIMLKELEILHIIMSNYSDALNDLSSYFRY